MDKFFETYGISREMFIELCGKLPEGATPDSFMVTLNILKNKYRMNSTAIRNVIDNRFDLVSDKDFITNLTRLQIRFKVSNDKISSQLSSWRVRDFSVDVDYLSKIQKELGLNPGELVSVICFSKIPRYKPDVDLMRRNIAILERAGFKRENLWRGISVLTCKPKRLVDVLMLGMVQGYDVNDFVMGNCHRVHSDIVYARMCAEREGIIPKGLVYLSDQDFIRSSNGITNEQLLQKFRFGSVSKLKLEKELLEKCPDKAVIIEEEAKDFAEYIDQSRHQFACANPENEEENKQILRQNFLTDEDIEWLFIKNEELKTLDPMMLKHSIGVLHFLLGGSDKLRCILSNPKLITHTDNRLYNCFKVLNESYGITRAEFSIIVRDFPGIINEFSDANDAKERLQKAERFYMSNFNLSKNDCKKVLISATSSYMYYEESKADEKLAYLGAFGIGIDSVIANEQLLSNASILLGKPDILLLKLKLAKLNGLPMEKFVNGSFMLSQNKVYARMMGVADNVVPANAVYVSKMEFNELVDSGKALDQAQLMDKYVLGYQGIVKINGDFASAYPDIQVKIDEIKKASILNRYKSEEKEVSDEYKLESFKRRLKRICELTDEQVEILFERIGKIDLDKCTNIIVNLYKLKSLGFLLDEIVKMPRILKSEPEEVELKAMMSRLIGKSDEQFLKRNYTYDANSIYAKFAESQKQGISFANMYNASGRFERALAKKAGVNTTVNFLKTLHPLNDSAKTAIRQQYSESFASVDEIGESENE